MALDRRDLIAWAGRDGVVQAPPDVVSRWNIPAAESRILSDVGLPAAVPPFFQARLQEETGPAMDGGVYRIGWDLGRDIGVAGDGRVLAVSADDEPMFVNSSLSLFAEFLHLVGRAYAARSPMTEEDVRALRERVRPLDPPALAEDGGGWWSLVFEQMEAGLL